MKESLIKDRIEGGIQNDQTRARLLRESDLTLSKAEDICRAAEATEAQMKMMNEESGVNAVSKQEPQQAEEHKQQERTFKCRFCGQQHPPRKEKCPAFGQTCRRCGKENHFASVCQSRPVRCIKEEIQEENGQEESFQKDDNIFIGAVSKTSQSGPKEWTSVLEIGGRHITFTLDTGSQANILPKNLFHRLKHGLLQYSKAH